MSGLMIMAGGTGGHVFPALAVAKELRERGVPVVWLGTRQGLEAKVVADNDFDIQWISITGLRGKSLLSWLTAPIKLIRAIWQSANVIRKVQPDCVLGMGGFVSGPGGIAAWLLRKPLIIHEQNAIAGLTNKHLDKIATRVLTGFPNVSNLTDGAKWVGNPVRTNIIPASEQHGGIRVLVVGGSQGAQSFNQYLPTLFSHHVGEIDIWHQTGVGNEVEVKAAYLDLQMDVRVSEFIDDMAAAYEWADLLVCRAGAMTVAECCAAGKPALLIPYPYSAGDHQLVNAMTMVAAKAGEMVSNEELSDGSMENTFAEMIKDRATLKVMGEAAYQLHKPYALRDLVSVCEEFLHA